LDTKTPQTAFPTKDLDMHPTHHPKEHLVLPANFTVVTNGQTDRPMEAASAISATRPKSLRCYWSLCD